eukprot:11210278-Lingulodinium_polyedra.AAC.1
MASRCMRHSWCWNSQHQHMCVFFHGLALQPLRVCARPESLTPASADLVVPDMGTVSWSRAGS